MTSRIPSCICGTVNPSTPRAISAHKSKSNAFGLEIRAATARARYSVPSADGLQPSCKSSSLIASILSPPSHESNRHTPRGGRPALRAPAAARALSKPQRLLQPLRALTARSAHPARRVQPRARLRGGARARASRACPCCRPRRAPCSARCGALRKLRNRRWSRLRAARSARALLRTGAPFIAPLRRLRAAPGAAALPPLPSGASPPGSAAPVRGSSRSVGAAFGRALASAGRLPETLVRACGCGVGPVVPLLRPLVLPRPRRRAVAVAAAPAPSPGSPPSAVPLFPPPVRAAGRLRGAPVGRAGACARCARFSPAAPPPAGLRVGAASGCPAPLPRGSLSPNSLPSLVPAGDRGKREACGHRCGGDGGCSEALPAHAACVSPL
jgi:hypothetical protein